MQIKIDKPVTNDICDGMFATYNSFCGEGITVRAKGSEKV